MAIYIGNTGQVTLLRSASSDIVTGSIRTSDVNTTANRFRFTYPAGTFISGDRIQIKSDVLLSFISPSGWTDGVQRNQGTWYVHVDLMGGLYLYSNFNASIAGELGDRVTLISPAAPLDVTVELQNASYQTLGSIITYEFNTERDSVDVTTLSDSFREQYSTLISGSGSIECFFDYLPPDASGSNIEKAIYLHQLLVRQQIGAEFKARLYLLSPDPHRSPQRANDSIWYELTGVLTNVGISFESDEAVRSRLEFISKGPVVLKVDTSD